MLSRVLNMVLLLLILRQLLQLWSVPMHLKVFLHTSVYFLAFYQVLIKLLQKEHWPVKIPL